MGDDSIVFPDQIRTSTNRPEEQPVNHFLSICFPLPSVFQVLGKISPLTIALVVLSLVLSLTLLGCLLFWWRRRRRRASKDQQAEPVNLSMSGTLGSAYGHTRGAFPGPESQSLIGSRKSSTVTNQTMERAEEMMMESRVSPPSPWLVEKIVFPFHFVSLAIFTYFQRERSNVLFAGESVH